MHEVTGFMAYVKFSRGLVSLSSTRRFEGWAPLHFNGLPSSFLRTQDLRSSTAVPVVGRPP